MRSLLFILVLLSVAACQEEPETVIDALIVRGQDDLEAALPRLRQAERIGELQLFGIEETDLAFLAGLRHIENLVLSQNDALTSLRGLENLEELHTLHLGQLPELRNADALDGTPIRSAIYVSNCHQLARLRLNTADTLQHITVTNCAALVTLELPDLHTVSGSLIVGDNASQRSVLFPSLKRVGEELLFTSLPALESFALGPAPVSVHRLVMQQLTTLTTLDGAEGLRSVDDEVSIRTSPALADLSALAATTVGRRIHLFLETEAAVCTTSGMVRNSPAAEVGVSSSESSYGSRESLLDACR